MSIDILVMGSSHMQAHELQTKENTASLLSTMFSFKVYNIGAGEHFLLSCLCNLKAAAEKYRPSKYIVIETPSIKFSDKVLKMAEAGTLPEAGVVNRGTLRLILRENKYFFHLWRLWRNINKTANTEYNQSEQINDTLFNDSEIMLRLMILAEETASSCGAKLIIAYHPSISLNKDGTLKINDDPEIVKQFSDLCSENGIYFLNMAERFLSEYEKSYTLPYGFINTSVGTGHMNSEGHRMFADEIYALIKRIEAKS